MTLDYLRLTGRPAADIALVEAYTKAQGLFRTDQTPEATYATVIDVDLGAVVPCLAGPRRPQDRVTLEGRASRSSRSRRTEMQAALKKGAAKPAAAATAVATALARVGRPGRSRRRRGRGDHQLHQHVEPERDDRRRPARQEGGRARPDQQAVGEDVARARLAGGHRLSPEGRPDDAARGARLRPRRLRLHDLHRQQRAAAGRGLGDHRGRRTSSSPRCCSGNRNFEGRIQPQVRANYLASPPLVVAYALAGTMTVDLTTEPLGTDPDGKTVFLKDIWPSEAEIAGVDAGGGAAASCSPRSTPTSSRATIAGARCRRRKASASPGTDDSTYIRKAPFFDNLTAEPAPLTDIMERARARRARRQRHHRPHLAGRHRSRRTARRGST